MLSAYFIRSAHTTVEMTKRLNNHIFSPFLFSKSKFTNTAIVHYFISEYVKQRNPNLENCRGKMFWVYLNGKICDFHFFTIFTQKIKIFLLCRCSIVLKMLLEAHK